MNLHLLDSQAPQFPNPRHAAEEPDGLLAVGGNLAPSTLIDAYRLGIFPWFGDDDPILWWSPATRCVIRPNHYHISKSLRKSLRRHQYQITTDKAFDRVVEACAAPRVETGLAATGTWITPEMMAAYSALHVMGYAHSVEVWDHDQLVGGVYGIASGAIFSGESMFSVVANGSKMALAYLCNWMAAKDFALLDCQIVNPHLLSVGAEPVARHIFLELMQTHIDEQLQWPEALEIDWS